MTVVYAVIAAIAYSASFYLKNHTSTSESFDPIKFCATLIVGIGISVLMLLSNVPLTEQDFTTQIVAYAGMIAIVETLLKALIKPATAQALSGMALILATVLGTRKTMKLPEVPTELLPVVPESVPPSPVEQLSTNEISTPLGVYNTVTKMFVGATLLPDDVQQKLRESVAKNLGISPDSDWFNEDWKPQKLATGAVVYTPVKAIESMMRQTAKAADLYPEAAKYFGIGKVA